MVRRGLAVSRTEAQEAISAGTVTIDGAPALKSATQVTPQQELVVRAAARRFVSRGGEKLLHAVERFELDLDGRVALDAGVSTGGFTDCLLQHGVSRVYAYDVGYGQVHERLRADPRVAVFERTNVRGLEPGDVPDPRPQVLVADLSFISLRLVLPSLLGLLDAAQAHLAVVLVKPQFEAQRHEVGKGGVVRDPAVWHRCLEEVATSISHLDWRIGGVVASPLLGPAGNVEFLVHLLPRGTPEPASPTEKRPGEAGQQRSGEVEVQEMIAAAVAEGRTHRESRRR